MTFTLAKYAMIYFPPVIRAFESKKYTIKIYIGQTTTITQNILKTAVMKAMPSWAWPKRGRKSWDVLFFKEMTFLAWLILYKPDIFVAMICWKCISRSRSWGRRARRWRVRRRVMSNGILLSQSGVSWANRHRKDVFARKLKKENNKMQGNTHTCACKYTCLCRMLLFKFKIA